MIKSGLSETNRARWEKFTPVIWIIAGALIMIPSLLGSTGSSFLVIGIMFIIFGIVFARKNNTDTVKPEKQ